MKLKIVLIKIIRRSIKTNWLFDYLFLQPDSFLPSNSLMLQKYLLIGKPNPPIILKTASKRFLVCNMRLDVEKVLSKKKYEIKFNTMLVGGNA